MSNATSYRLDVATHATFSGGGGLSEQVVLASNGATAASVNQDGWSAVDTGGSTYAQMLKSTSTITTPAFSTVGLTNLTAVSYTHLDVYKRQGYSWALPHPPSNPAQQGW